MSYHGPERRHPRNPVLRALRELGHDPPPSARWHHIWRDFVPLAALIIAAVAVVGNEKQQGVIQSKVDQAQVDATVANRSVEVQREGRRVAVAVTCGALQGVARAGRLVITDRLPGTEDLRQPSTPQERQARRAYARAYSRVIASSIRRQAPQARGVVRVDGTINCDALSRAALTVP